MPLRASTEKIEYFFHSRHLRQTGGCAAKYLPAREKKSRWFFLFFLCSSTKINPSAFALPHKSRREKKEKRNRHLPMRRAKQGKRRNNLPGFFCPSILFLSSLMGNLSLHRFAAKRQWRNMSLMLDLRSPPFSP